MATNKDIETLNLLAIFHYVVAALAALFACFPLIHFTVGVLIVSGIIPMETKPEEAMVPLFVGWFFIVIAGMFILTGWTLALFIFICGRKLKKRRHRMFCMVVAGIESIFMPFGTVLGVFTLVTLNRDSVAALFDENL